MFPVVQKQMIPVVSWAFRACCGKEIIREVKKQAMVADDATLRCRALGLPRLIGRAFSELEPACQAVLGGDPWASKAANEFTRLMQLQPEKLVGECVAMRKTPVAGLFTDA